MAKAGISGLAARLGEAGRKAFDEHKSDEMVVSGGGDCPPGIDNGVAQLVDIKFGEYETGDMKGKLYCYFAAVVVAPKTITVDGYKLPCAGLRISNIEPICDTPTRSRKTISDHMGWIQNEMRKLGLDTTGLKWEQFEASAAALVSAAPFFQFRSWKSEPTPQFPNPRVNYTWGTEIADYQSDIDPDAGIVESTPEPTAKTETKKTATSTPAAKTTTAPAKGKKTAPIEDVPFGDDLDMTADKADKGDEDAKIWLTKKARELGYKDDDVENTADWQEVATMIRDKQEATNGESGDETDYDALGSLADGGDQDAATQVTEWATENGIDVNDHPDKSWAEFVTFVSESLGLASTEAVIPEKGQVWDAVLVKGKKATSVEIVAVFPDKRTCNVKCLDTAKAYKGISFDMMTEAS